jgi:hypothetical protein
MDVANAVSLLYHEAGHSMDNYYQDCDCGHGKGRNANSPIGKENTFQYSLNKFVRSFYGLKPKVRTLGRWARIKRWFRNLF